MAWRNKVFFSFIFFSVRYKTFRSYEIYQLLRLFRAFFSTRMTRKKSVCLTFKITVWSSSVLPCVSLSSVIYQFALKKKYILNIKSRNKYIGMWLPTCYRQFRFQAVKVPDIQYIIYISSLSHNLYGEQKKVLQRL